MIMGIASDRPAGALLSHAVQTMALGLAHRNMGLVVPKTSSDPALGCLSDPQVQTI